MFPEVQVSGPRSQRQFDGHVWMGAAYSGKNEPGEVARIEQASERGCQLPFKHVLKLSSC